MRAAASLVFFMLAGVVPAGMAVAAPRSAPYIVAFRETAVADAGAANSTRQDVDRGRVRSHVDRVQSQLRITVGNVYDSALGGFSANLTAAQVRALRSDPAVESVTPDEEISFDDITADGSDEASSGIRTISDLPATVPPGIERVGAPRNSLSLVAGGERSVNADVAVLDTGIERNHPDLNVQGGYNCTGSQRDKWADGDGHGTHVAGTIGARDNNFGVVGVAPGVRLWSVKVLNSNGSGLKSWLVCGIDWVTSRRDPNDRTRPLFEVANMSISYGGAESECGKSGGDTVHTAICRSVRRGTVYVVAAGNEARNARFNRPASYDEVITVSAMADYDGRGGGQGKPSDSCPYWSPEGDDEFVEFSNFGADVDLIAPGRCILSTYPGARYAWMSGTSMATPHVSGAAAIYRALFSWATPDQVKRALQATGTRDWQTGSDPDDTHERALWIGEVQPVPPFSEVSFTRPSIQVEP